MLKKFVFLVLSILIVTSTSAFSVIAIGYPGLFKDSGTHPDGRKWVGCWVHPSTCYIWIPENQDLSAPNEVNVIWISDEGIGWTDIGSPVITNKTDSLTTDDYDELTFSVDSETTEHTSYSSWESEVLSR